jgi:EpsI family protein
VALLCAGIASVCIVTGLLMSFGLSQLAVNRSEAMTGLPVTSANWRGTSSAGGLLRPTFAGATSQFFGSYLADGKEIEMAVIQYETQSHTNELIGGTNAVVDPDLWQILSAEKKSVSLPLLRSVDLQEVVARRGEETCLIWYWFDVNGSQAASEFRVKFLEGRNALLRRPTVSSVVILSLATGEDRDAGRLAMKQFLGVSYAGIQQCLAGGHGEIECGLPVPARPDRED